MCAWWSGQPVYGSIPVSKVVRENFDYLKSYVDLLSASGITLAQLANLMAINSSPAEINGLDGGGAANTYYKGTGVNLGGAFSNLALRDGGIAVGHLPLTNVNGGTITIAGLTFRPSIIFVLVASANQSWSIGFDAGINGSATVCLGVRFNAPLTLMPTVTPSYCYYLESNTNLLDYGRVSAWTADGFTITQVVNNGGSTGGYFEAYYVALP